VPKVAERAACGALLAVTLVVMAGSALAEGRVLYRWTDAQGRVQYSDRPPTGFKGEVTRVDIDVDATPAPVAAPRAPIVAPEVLRDVVPPAVDINKARREKREKLEAAVRNAEKKVASAKAALDGGGDPQDGEGQVIQRHFARPQAGHSNCRRVTDGAGRPGGFVCPAVVPNDEYYERIKGLEEALKKAEAELAQAEIDYRRGVD
jgi:hypothetical protein